MYQGTTPTITITFKDIDLTEAKIYLTIEDERQHKQMTFQTPDDFRVTLDGTDTKGTIHLTQEQTLALSSGSCVVQARFIFQDGEAGATTKANLNINQVLLKGVIGYD